LTRALTRLRPGARRDEGTGCKGDAHRRMSIMSAIESRPVRPTSRDLAANCVPPHLKKESVARVPPGESRRRWMSPIA